MVEIISPWAIEILAFPSRQYVQSVKSSHYDFKDPGRSHRGSNIAETFASLDGRLEFGYSEKGIYWEGSHTPSEQFISSHPGSSWRRYRNI